MKKIFSLLSLVLLFPVFLLSQVPQRINYQGVARDNTGNPLVNQPIGLKFAFRDGGPSATIVYEETHTDTTNALGLFSLHLGDGAPVTGAFNDISWNGGLIWLEVSMDATGGTSYTLMGSSELVSVPYALLADSALSGGSKWTDGTYGIYRNGRVSVGNSGTYDNILLYAGDSTTTHDIAGWFNKNNAADTATALISTHYGQGEALAVGHYGTDGNGFYLETIGSTNTAASAYVYNTNPSDAVIINNNNNTGSGYALLVQNNTSGSAIAVNHFNATGGSAGEFFSSNPTNSAPALRADNAGTGPAGQFAAGPNSTTPALVVLQNSITGVGGHITLTNPNNTGIGLHLQNPGKGSALKIDNTNTASPTPAILVDHMGMLPGLQLNNLGMDAGAVFNNANAGSPMPAVKVVQMGTVEGATFEIMNAGNGEASVWAKTSGTGSAGYFETSSATSAASTVEASCNGNSSSRAGNFANYGTGTGVYGQKPSAGFSGRAGHFQNFYTGNLSDGVLIQTNATIGGSYALHTNHTGGGKGILISGGGDVGGNFDVSGMLTKGGGTFKIDHPLDPENKYLYHSFVESPDMMNIYNGVAVLDASGKASVKMPDWFYALNKNFRYQLTCIGGFAPVYISQKITGNTFEISGGTPGLEVSWQVTGVRQDAFANYSRVQVEVEKPAEEKGTYLHPEAHGKPVSMGMMERLQREHGNEQE